MTLRLGPLEAIAEREHVTDIVVTSDGRVWSDSGAGLKQEVVESGLSSPEVMRDFAVRLCAQLGRRLDDSCPIADASTAQGVRIHAVIAPLVPQGAALSIRLPDTRRTSLEDLQACGFCPGPWIDFLRGLMRAHASILISGGTGTGKTTLLRVLLGECDSDERIVTVEEIRELAIPPKQHCESLVVREPNIEGAGGVGLEDLVKATVRMRPDRIVLGECRGEEIADLLRAFNSGHKGGMVTIHSDGIERLPARLISLGLLADMQPAATAFMAQGAFDCLIHLSRAGGLRHIEQMGRFLCRGDGSLAGDVVARWNGQSAPRYSPTWDSWRREVLGAGDEQAPYGSGTIQGKNDDDKTVVFPRVKNSDSAQATRAGMDRLGDGMQPLTEARKRAGKEDEWI